MSERYLCNFLIPGSGKSGTTSLHAVLSQHPDICGSSPKEPQFFSFEERFRFGAAEHNKIFDHQTDAKYYCEASQCYFAHEKAIKRIKECLDAPKIILMVRDPIERLISQHKWNYRRGTETSPLKKAVFQRGETTNYVFDERINSYREEGGYLAFSRYSKWVPIWKDTFGEENVLVLKFDDFKKDQQAIVSHCCSFLGLSTLPSVKDMRQNETGKTYARVSPGFMRAIAKSLPQSFREGPLYSRFRRRAFQALTKHPKETSDEEIRFLEDLLSRDKEFYQSLPSVL